MRSLDFGKEYPNNLKLFYVMKSQAPTLLPLLIQSERETEAEAMASLRIKAKSLFLALSLLAASSAAENLMFNGESLNTGDFLEIGPYRFIMQSDCNLVLYVNRTRALWSSGTNGRGISCRATLQNNGNLVVLSGSDVVWTSNSARGSNNYRLIVQSDGNVVIYGAALWATNTVQSRKRLL